MYVIRNTDKQGWIILEEYNLLVLEHRYFTLSDARLTCF